MYGDMYVCITHKESAEQFVFHHVTHVWVGEGRVELRNSDNFPYGKPFRIVDPAYWYVGVRSL